MKTIASANKTQLTVRRIAISALFAALSFCGTYFIKIPMPFAEGYIDAGDGFVFLAAVILPAPYAAAAAAIGAGLSDLIGGYPLWIPATIGVRVIAVLFFTRRGKVFCRRNLIALAASAAVNVIGYWLYESAVVYQNLVGGLAAMPFNLAQSVVGIILFLALAKPARSVVERTLGEI